MNKQEILQYLKSIKPIFQKRGIENIAIFGSVSKNNSNVYSDIDIAIKKDKDFLKKYSAYDYFNTLNELKSNITRKFGRNVDIFDLESKSSFLESIKKDLIYV